MRNLLVEFFAGDNDNAEQWVQAQLSLSNVVLWQPVTFPNICNDSRKFGELPDLAKPFKVNSLGQS